MSTSGPVWGVFDVLDSLRGGPFLTEKAAQAFCDENHGSRLGWLVDEIAYVEHDGESYPQPKNYGPAQVTLPEDEP